MIKHLWVIGLVGMVIFQSCNISFETEPTNYTTLGDSLVTKTFDTLSVSLRKHLSVHGPAGAVLYCNVHADSLTKTYNSGKAHIKRTALYYRNPGNAPDPLELSQLDYFDRLLDSGKMPSPKLIGDYKGVVHYFKPIIMQPMCTGCHGTPDKEIMPETWKVIREKYPDDKAIGFKPGDLRGMWHITFSPFKKEKSS